LVKAKTHDLFHDLPPQSIYNPKPYNFAILVITVAFGFIAGLTFDTVFKKLESVDVVCTDALKKTQI